MQVALLDLRHRWPEGSRKTIRYHKQGAPFFWNCRGVLVHRVRAVCDHLDPVRHGRVRHQSVTYWCNNLCTAGQGTFYEDPPQNRLLCVACERLAVKAGEPPASELAGRHVCLGRLKPQRICCHEDQN